MKRWIVICILPILVIGMVLMSGCTSTEPLGTEPVAPTTPPIVNETLPVTPNQTAAVLATNQTPSARDPILGPWRNGLFFYANGTVDSDGTVTWKANKNENNSYFVISDVPSAGSNNIRNITSTEWRYNPATDKINIRGSSESFSRGIPTPKPTQSAPTATIQTPSPAVTTIRTSTTAVPSALYQGTGSLFIHTGGLGSDITIYIAPDDGTYLPPIIPGALNPAYTMVNILPDGCSERVSLPPGRYIAYLPAKNGEQPEQQSFVINANYNTEISFLGLSYRSSGGGGCGG